MSYYTELDDDLGQIEEAERDFRELEFERNRKLANEKTRIRNEVKNQLKLSGVNSKNTPRGVKIKVSCGNCKGTFEARVADVNRGWGKFCSKSCKAKKQKYNGYLHR